MIDRQKKISAAKNKVVLAVAHAKESLGLQLTHKEIGAVQRVQESAVEAAAEQAALIAT